MPLTSQQHETVLALEWLFNPENRGAGRTFAQAVALIRIAAQRPGQRLNCLDHAGVSVDQFRVNQFLLDNIRALVFEDEHLQRYFEVSQHRASFWFRDDMEPLMDWWPHLEVPLPPMVAEHAVESLFKSIVPPPAVITEVQNVSRWAYL